MATTNADIPAGFAIAGIFIPVVAAAVTGALALVSGRKHTTERLKNLIEISKDLPDTLNAKYAMQKAMLTYVRDIERSASRWFRGLVNGSIFLIVTEIGIALLLRFSKQLNVSEGDRRVLFFAYFAFPAILAVGYLVVLIRDAIPFDRAYEARVKVLKQLADSEVNRVRTEAESIKRGAGPLSKDAEPQEKTEPQPKGAESQGDDGEPRPGGEGTQPNKKT